MTIVDLAGSERVKKSQHGCVRTPSRRPPGSAAPASVAPQPTRERHSEGKAWCRASFMGHFCRSVPTLCYDVATCSSAERRMGWRRRSMLGTKGDARFKEATNINTSLLAMGNVVQALAKQQVWLTYTRIDSLTRGSIRSHAERFTAGARAVPRLEPHARAGGLAGRAVPHVAAGVRGPGDVSRHGDAVHAGVRRARHRHRRQARRLPGESRLQKNATAVLPLCVCLSLLCLSLAH